MSRKKGQSMPLVTIHLPAWTLEAIDSLIESGIYPSRSEFIRAAVLEKLAILGGVPANGNGKKSQEESEDINVIIPQFMPQLDLERAKNMKANAAAGDAAFALLPPCYLQSTAVLDLIKKNTPHSPTTALYSMLKTHSNDLDIINVGNLVFYRRLDIDGEWSANPICREYSLESYLHAVTRGLMYLMSTSRARRICVRARTLLHAITASIKTPKDSLPHIIISAPNVRLDILRFAAKLLGIYDGEMRTAHNTLLCVKKI